MPDPHYEADGVTVLHGECIETMRSLADDSVDAIVTDPPYGLGFMGKAWDDLPPGEGWARECLRVLKPGGHLLAFGGTRTWHRLAVAVEDAGFEVRDSIAWLYGSGFPKSLDVSKAIDKRKDWEALPLLQAKVKTARTAAGMSQSEAARACGLIGPDESLGGGGFMWFETGMRIPTRDQYLRLKAALGIGDECDAAFDEAEREVTGHHEQPTAQQAWMANYSDHVPLPPKERRDNPATDAAAQWQGWGTALKPAFEPIVVARKPLIGTVAANVLAHGTGALNIDGCRVAGDVPTTTRGGNQFGVINDDGWQPSQTGDRIEPHAAGRWPANVVLDADAAAVLDEQSGTSKSGAAGRRGSSGFVDGYEPGDYTVPYGDTGGASRFFYVAKAPTRERPKVNGIAHPTVKPLALMRWLVRLVTPPGGVVLDPFLGSGTTAQAARDEGFRCIGIERETDYLPLIVSRLEAGA